MDGIIKVTPETLQSTAAEFSSQGQQLNTLTTSMMELVQALNSIWTGEASAAFINRFTGLQQDMDKMFRMVQEHSQDLQDMATAYQQAETTSQEAAQALSANVIV